KAIGDDIQKDDFFKVIREDPKVPGLLYAGGERGFYISFDGGQKFNKWQLNLPVVPITDMVIRDNDLAISTAGRSFWVLDDLSPIQQSKGQLVASGVQIFEPKPTPRMLMGAPFYLITEHAYGENPPVGVQLDYYVADVNDASLKLEILDQSGSIIRSYEGTKEPIVMPMQGGRGNIPVHNTAKLPYQQGLNRFTWDFRTQGITKVKDNVFVQGADYRGHQVAPGTYTARLSQGDQVSEAKIVVLDPPDINVPKALWEQQQDLLKRIEDDINNMHEALNISLDMKDKIQRISKEIEPLDDMDDLQEGAKGLAKKMDNWLNSIIELRQKNFQDALNWPAGINAEFFLLRGNLDTYNPDVPKGYQDRYQDLQTQWQSYKMAYDKLMAEDVAAFNELFKSKGLPALGRPIEKKEGL
ncbi:MAG: glycosyl hydrolase, partial [Bacteroidota bacterium]